MVRVPVVEPVVAPDVVRVERFELRCAPNPVQRLGTVHFSLSLGGLFFVLIMHLTRAGWSVTLRRLAEVVAWAVVPLTALAVVDDLGAVMVISRSVEDTPIVVTAPCPPDGARRPRELSAPTTGFPVPGEPSRTPKYNLGVSSCSIGTFGAGSPHTTPTA